MLFAAGVCLCELVEHEHVRECVTKYTSLYKIQIHCHFE